MKCSNPEIIIEREVVAGSGNALDLLLQIFLKEMFDKDELKQLKKVKEDD